MSITISFVCVVAAVLVGGSVFRRWDESRSLRFTDETGSSVAVLAVARFEARKLLRHPTWLITLGFITVVTSVLVYLDPHLGANGDEPVVWFALIVLPLAGLALIVSMHRIGTRSRRDHTEELEAATPTSPRTRTTALLVASLAPVPVFLAVVAFNLVLSGTMSRYVSTPTMANSLPAAGFVLAGLGGGIVGVLLSRWLPFAVAPLLGIVAIIWLNNGPDHLHPRFRWLRVGVEGSYGGRFDIRPSGLLALFVLALILLGACLALWRHPARPRLIASTAAAVVVVTTIGWTMTRPPSASEVAVVVDELENPVAHQRCESRAAVRYCVFAGSESWVDAWAPGVQGVLAQTPATARPADLVLVQRPPVDPREFLAEVRDALDGALVWPADGRIHPALDIDGSRPDLLVAWQTAAIAVGLPASADWEHPSGCMAGGQARLVLAHVLAARATPTTRAAFRTQVVFVNDDHSELSPVPIEIAGEFDVDTQQGQGSELAAGDRSAADGVTPVNYLTPVGASGWGSDVLAADDLLHADRKVLDAAIAAHWGELIAPATPTSRLLKLAGVAASAPTRAMTSATEAAACP